MVGFEYRVAVMTAWPCQRTMTPPTPRKETCTVFAAYEGSATRGVQTFAPVAQAGREAERRTEAMPAIGARRAKESWRRRCMPPFPAGHPEPRQGATDV